MCMYGGFIFVYVSMVNDRLDIITDCFIRGGRHISHDWLLSFRYMLSLSSYFSDKRVTQMG